MVVPCDMGSERKSSVGWRNWLIGFAVVSLLGGVVVWGITKDWALAIRAFVAPWIIAIICALVSIFWGFVTMPLMLWIARRTNGRTRL